MALILMTADLAAANSRYVLTVPQSMFDTKPEVVKAIEDAERDRPLPRAISHPPRAEAGTREAGPRPRRRDRSLEVARWDHDTLKPKHGIEYGLEYTYTIGVGELDGL